jgi:hypothetical protein
MFTFHFLLISCSLPNVLDSCTVQEMFLLIGDALKHLQAHILYMELPLVDERCI